MQLDNLFDPSNLPADALLGAPIAPQVPLPQATARQHASVTIEPSVAVEAPNAIHIAAAPRIANARSSHFGHLAYRAGRRLLKMKIADIFALDLLPLLDAKPVPSSTYSRFEFRFLSADDVRRAGQDESSDLPASLADHLDAANCFCFGAFDHGQLANYSWYAFDHVEPEHCFGATLRLPSDAVYMYKAFTLPTYRGLRLHEATMHRAVRAMSPLEARRLLAVIEYGNAASRHSHIRMGCQCAGRFWMMGDHLLRWESDDRYANLIR